jgi:hypothetical protein
MSNISPSTHVFVWLLQQNGQRYWIKKVDNLKDPRLDKLVLTPTLDDDQAYASPFSYQAALILRRRLLEDNPLRNVRFSLTPDGDEIATGGTNSAPDKDGRQILMYRGLLVHPGYNTRQGCPCWFVKFPRHAIESVSGDTPEQAVDRTYERNLQDKAEQAPAPQAPEPEKKIYSGPVIRPGDRS